MKVLLLCAGYGTRLRRDLLAAGDRYSHLLHLPKPLLPVAGVPLATRWVEQVAEADPEARIAVVVNEKYREEFEKWAEGVGVDGVRLVSDGTSANEDRLGAVACIQLALEKELGFDDDVLVVAGDTLFPPSFSLEDFLADFSSLQEREGEARSLVVETACSDEEVSKRGIVEVDPSTRLVTSFLEKPSPSETASRSQAPCFYLLHRRHLPEVGAFLRERADGPLEARDATGNFLRHLVEGCLVHAHRAESRFDVGGLDTYLECCRAFERTSADESTKSNL